MGSRPISLVTGGAGFLGSHMVDLLLAKGHHVRVLDDFSSGRYSNIETHDANADLEIVEKDVVAIEASDTAVREVNFVFHFAGLGDIVPSVENPLIYMTVNVMGTLKLLEAVRYSSSFKKFLYAASSSCYGMANTPTSENHIINPQIPYALSKYQGEQIVLHWNQLYGLPMVSLRIFNAYGVRSRTTGTYGAVIGTFLKQKLANRPFTVVGDGSQKRDFIYCTDIARAFWAAAQSSTTNQIFNLGTGNPQSINRLVELLNGPVVHIPKRPGEPDITWANTEKISRELAWRPMVKFENGIAEILKHIDYWQDAPLWDPASIKKATEYWFEAFSNSA